MENFNIDIGNFTYHNINIRQNKWCSRLRGLIFLMKFNLKNIFCKKTEYQLIHFFFIGLTTATIYFLLLILFTEKLEIHYIFSAAAGGIISSTINFSLNKKITFKERLEKNFFKEYWKFGTIKIICGLIGLVIIFTLTDLAEFHYLTSSVIALGLISTTGFLANKFITFNK